MYFLITSATLKSQGQNIFHKRLATAHKWVKRKLILAIPWIKISRFSTIPKYQVRLIVEALFFPKCFFFSFSYMLKANFFFFFFFFFFFLQCLTGFNKFWEFHYNLFGQEIKLTLLWVHIIVFAQKLAFWLLWLSLYLFLDFFGPKGNQLSPDMVWHRFIHIATCHVEMMWR